MISKETIDKVMELADIVPVVSDFVKLKKQGSGYTANCPFHNESTGSFMVSASKNIYKCFGCGKGGNNSVSFVMEHEKYTFPEAIRWLANKFNIEVVEDELSDNKKAELHSKENFYLINEFAKKSFMANAEFDKTATEYFIERGIDEESRRVFEIGYATSDETSLYDHALANHFKAEMLQRAGLVNSNHGVSDTFRERIMFPIHNLTGRIVGFGGRIVTREKTKLAKFINTMENEVYQKRDVLYGLWQAKRDISKKNECLLVEGYNDVVLFHQEKLQNTVASSGTALTLGHIKLIKRFTSNLTILFDGDAAGLKAATAGIEIAIEEGMSVRVVMFPMGEDPDSYVRKIGGSEMQNYISSNKLDVIDFFFRDLANLSIQERDDLGAVILRIIAKIPVDRIFSIDAYTKKLARLFGASAQKIAWRITKLRGSIESNSEPMSMLAERTADNYELEFIKVLVRYGASEILAGRPAYFYMMERCGTAETFRDPLARSIFELYYSELQNGRVPDMDFFLDHNDEQISGFARNLNLSRNEYSPVWDGQGCATAKKPDEIVKNAQAYFLIFKFREMAREAQEKMATETDRDLMAGYMKQDMLYKKGIASECRKLGINYLFT